MNQNNKKQLEINKSQSPCGQVKPIVVRRNAPLRQYKTPTLCKSCEKIVEFNCKWKYQINYNNFESFKCVTACSGYIEQVV